MHRHLIDLVERLGRPRVCLVGDVMLDRYVFGDAERISREAPIQVLRVAYEENRLGGAGSVATNLLVLGAKVDVFAVIGRDEAGERILKDLRAQGARTAGVLRLKDRPTTVKTRFVGRAQHRISQQVLRVDQEDVRPIGRSDEDRLLAGIARSLRRADAVLLSDYNKGVLTPRLTRTLIRRARAAGVPVLVDPIFGRDYSKYRRATLITPNRVETEMSSGIPLTGPAAIRRAARHLLQAHAFEAVAITLDKDGAHLAVRGRPGQMVPTRPRVVYDNAGAGDMFISAMAIFVAAGESYLDAARLANIAGGLEVEKFGVQTVSREEILRDLLGEVRRGGDKIRSLHNLLVDLGRHRSFGETIVFTNGCFDLIHPGHIAYFDFAAAQGDILVVGLNTDAGVRRLKGPGRPVCDQQSRARVLAGMEAVDYIVLFGEDTPDRLIRRVRPDVLVKGEDWRTKGVVGRQVVESYGGRVVFAPLLKGMSTTSLVERIRNARGSSPGSRKGGAS